jgi:hypothetical protein
MTPSSIDLITIPLVQTRLPPEGLEAFLERPWQPIVNAANVYHESPESLQSPGQFPLRYAAMAPNSSEFLASLGKPLAHARDLESSPGVWWLATADHSYHYVIFSDCHRKNAWKGGQICMSFDDNNMNNFNPQNPGLVALLRGFQAVWGQPENIGEMDFLRPWFKERSKLLGELHWPINPPAPSDKRRTSLK